MHFRPANGSGAEPAAAAEPILDEGVRLPWTSRALGLNDLGLVAARSVVQLVGVIGPHNAGKTSLLTAMFSHFAQTGQVASHGFAGSFTLQGWSRLRAHTAWPSPLGPTFPPHTPASSERVPSLLHLALRRENEAIRDILFTDAPGEWFTRWMRNHSSEEAKGARWIMENATHLVFVVDRADLAGEEGGLVKLNTLALARLVSEHRCGRPILVVWAKSDGKVDLEMEKPVRRGLEGFFGKDVSLDLSADDPRCVKILETALADAANLARVPLTLPTPGASAFMAYQGGAL